MHFYIMQYVLDYYDRFDMVTNYKLIHLKTLLASDLKKDTSNTFSIEYEMLRTIAKNKHYTKRALGFYFLYNLKKIQTLLAPDFKTDTSNTLSIEYEMLPLQQINILYQEPY